MSDGAGGPVAAFPNPGLPQLVGGQIRFSRDVGHFAGYGVKLAEAGARLIGGCCGTTPDHVRALSQALEGFSPKAGRARGQAVVVEARDHVELSGEPVTGFAEK